MCLLVVDTALGLAALLLVVVGDPRSRWPPRSATPHHNLTSTRCAQGPASPCHGHTHLRTVTGPTAVVAGLLSSAALGPLTHGACGPSLVRCLAAAGLRCSRAGEHLLGPTYL